MKGGCRAQSEESVTEVSNESIIEPICMGMGLEGSKGVEAVINVSSLG
jgi:hypothetical protein